MTPLTEALERLDEIHSHLAKGEVYRGLTAKPVALSGLAGVLAAACQPYLVPAADAVGFVWYWLGAAVVCALVGCCGVILSYVLEDDDLARRRARIVAGQFVPCVVGGLLLTLALRSSLAHCVGLMPAWWAVLYGLGLFSARPYLPRVIGWVAAYYLFAGIFLAAILRPDVIPSPWTVGVIFFMGQLALAGVLYRNERREVIDAW